MKFLKSFIVLACTCSAFVAAASTVDARSEHRVDRLVPRHYEVSPQNSQDYGVSSSAGNEGNGGHGSPKSHGGSDGHGSPLSSGSHVHPHP